MRYVLTSIIFLCVISVYASKTHAQYEALQNLDSLKHYYNQYDAYTPQAEERANYYTLKYTLAWLMQDESKVMANMKELSSLPFEGKVNQHLIIDLQFASAEQLPKIYQLLNSIIAKTSSSTTQLPLIISKVDVLDRMNNDALTMEELPQLQSYFKDFDTATAYIDGILIKVLGRNNKVDQALQIASSYLSKPILNQDIFGKYVQMLFAEKRYQQVIDQVKLIQKNKRLDLYPELSLSYAVLGDVSKAVDYMDVIYSNMHYRTNEEINMTLSSYDTTLTMYPEAYIEYELMDEGLGFHFVSIEQFEAMADVYVQVDQKSKACTFYQYAVLGINAYNNNDIAVIMERNRNNNSLNDNTETAILKIRSGYEESKKEIINKTIALKQCNLQIK